MRTLRIGFLAAGLLIAAPSSFAQQVSASFGVSAMVVRGCAIGVPDLAFGNYQALGAPAEVLATTTISVTCGLGDTYTIGLSDGVNATGAQRRMARTPGPTYLSYNLFRDAAHTQEWRDTGQTRASGIGTGAAQQFTVFGQLPGAQVVPAGTYVDTVTVTVRN